MNATAFNSQKMRWLNEINADCDISSTSFRVAYAIADHLNRVTGCAWPSNTRIAKRMGLSNKSISRAIGELENRGWLNVKRSRMSTNEYRLAWPSRSAEHSSAPNKEDISVQKRGQFLPNPEDSNVPQSYLSKLPRTYSSRLSEKQTSNGAFRDRGRYEQQLVDRFGPDVWGLLSELHELDPASVDRLCTLQKAGELTPADIDVARLAVRHKIIRKSMRYEASSTAPR